MKSQDQTLEMTCFHEIKRKGRRCKNRVTFPCKLYCRHHAYIYNADDKICVDTEYVNTNERHVLMKALEKLNKELDKKKKTSKFMNKEIKG